MSENIRDAFASLAHHSISVRVCQGAGGDSWPDSDLCGQRPLSWLALSWLAPGRTATSELAGAELAGALGGQRPLSWLAHELAGALSGQRPLSWLALTPGPLVNHKV